ncbi:MAG: TMEM165/GDT1 family protein [Deltaproteobacteria bacterium]|nr:TMEM165/GDT1 family protein [Deltaproteobacteria bacterium]
MSAIELFATVFGVIFVAELPDKTALAALVLATRHRAAPVFLGAASALTVQSIVAVAAGSLFARLPPQYVRIGSGALFVICAIVMWFRKHDDAKQAKEASGFWRAFASVFVVIFLAEWGDLTQIGTAALEAKYHRWPIVMAASVSALWCVAALAVFVGNRAGRLLDPKLTQKVAAAIFLLVGIALIVGLV